MARVSDVSEARRVRLPWVSEAAGEALSEGALASDIAWSPDLPASEAAKATTPPKAAPLTVPGKGVAGPGIRGAGESQ